MPDHPPDPQPSDDETEAGYRDTLEEEAYEAEESDASDEETDDGN